MILKDCEQHDQRKRPESSEMFTGSGSIYQVVILCREPSDKSFSNHLMAQADLLTNIMVQLRGRTGKVPNSNAMHPAGSKYSGDAPVARRLLGFIISVTQAAESLERLEHVISNTGY